MFEEKTYETILEEMLDAVTSDVDKREGSVIYDALAPAALKLAETYFELNNFIDLVFADTAVGEYLDRIAVDHGMSRKEAVYAIRKVETSGPIDIGTRWSLSDLIFTVTEKITDTSYYAECNIAGSTGNMCYGTLENIDNVSGVTADLTDIITTGQDVESDDNLRERFYYKVQLPSTSGNVSDYLKWALDVPGVGNAKIYPLWNGPGTVKVLIVNSNNVVDQTLEQKTLDYIENVRPIGATVTVDSLQTTGISINVKVSLDGSKTLTEVKDLFEDKVSDYIKSCVFTTNTVSAAKIGSLILDTEGINDYSDLKLNNSSSNVTIEDGYIPVLDEITFAEV